MKTVLILVLALATTATVTGCHVSGSVGESAPTGLPH